MSLKKKSSSSHNSQSFDVIDKENTPLLDNSLDPNQSIEAKINAFSTRLSLPLSKKALGVLEGEHSSSLRGSGYDFLDLRDYESSDEARLIDWKATARARKPIVLNKQREVISTIWFLLDAGREMTGSCPSGESLITVATNTLRMFAALSLKRSDTISLLCGNSQSITRVPFSGNYQKFSRVLTSLLQAIPPAPRDIESLLNYAAHSATSYNLMVLATSDDSIEQRYINLIAHIAQTHPFVIAPIKTANPFDTTFSGIETAQAGRIFPSFLQNQELQHDVDWRKQVESESLINSLKQHGGTILSASSSEEMLKSFMQLVDSTQIKQTLGSRHGLSFVYKGGA